MMYYDQDIMGITSYDWPHRFFKVPRVYNWRWRPGRDFNVATWGADSGICIEHFSHADYGDDEGQGRSALFSYWRDYRRVWPGESASVRRVRPLVAPAAPWDWEYGSGRSLGRKKIKS